MTTSKAVDTNTTAPVTLNDQYPVLVNSDALTEAILENTGGQLSANDLARYKSAGSGVEQFVNVDTGEITPTLDGVIVGWGKARSYWQGETPADGTPPSCSSLDAVNGHGVRFEGDRDGVHDCTTCPLSKFGSSFKDGSEGQACKEFRQVLLLEPNHSLPTLIRVPPTSIKTFTRYLVAGLTSLGLPYFGVITRITLKAEESRSGYKTAIMRFEALGELPAQILSGARSIKGALGTGYKPSPVTADAIEVAAMAGGDEESL